MTCFNPLGPTLATLALQMLSAVSVIYTDPSLLKISFLFILLSYSARSVLREDINKLHRQLLDERSRADKIKQDLVCLKFFCPIQIFNLTIDFNVRFPSQAGLKK